MKAIEPEEYWPESWRKSYSFDLMEVYGETPCFGYAYAYKNRQQHTFQLVEKYANPPARVLDIAGAQGNFSLLLAERGYCVTWNDIREELAGYVKLKQQTPLQFLPGNVFELTVEEPFDLVLMTEVIEHVAHPDKFLEQTAKLVKPGGFIVLTTPNGEYFRNNLPRFSDCPDPSRFEADQFKPDSDGHIFLLHLDEIFSLAKRAQLEVTEIRYFTNPLTSGHMKTEHLLKTLPLSMVNMIESLTYSWPQLVKRKFCIQIGAVLQRMADAPR